MEWADIMDTLPEEQGQQYDDRRELEQQEVDILRRALALGIPRRDVRLLCAQLGIDWVLVA